MHGRLPWVVCALYLAGCIADDAGGTAGSGSSGSGGSTTTSAGSTGATSGGTTMSSQSGSGGSSGGDETGIRPGDNCQVDADCVLDDDCCHCQAYQDSLPDGHGCAVDACDQSTCEANGVPNARALCLNGNCLLPKITCDPATLMTCDVFPDCPPGTVPEIVDNCNTGDCIPLSSCSEVAYFGCEECGPDEACVRFSNCSGDACGSATACLSTRDPAPTGCTDGGEAVCSFFGVDYPCYDEPNGGFYCCGGDASACRSAG